MDLEPHLTSGLSRQISGQRNDKLSLCRNLSLNPRQSIARFSFGRQSSLDPKRRSRSPAEELALPANLDSTMQLLYLACQGDAEGVEMFLENGVDVNSIDFDGRTALHIAACAGHANVVMLVLSWEANIDARDRWGSTAATDAKFYGNIEVYNILRARGAKAPKMNKTPMIVSDPEEVPDYELNSGQIQIRRGGEILKGTYQVGKWNDIKVSVKIFDNEAHSDADSIAAFKHELNLLQKSRHPNLIQFVGAVTQNIPMMIVLEYHPKGDLGSYLQKKGRLQPHKAFGYSIEIARGMNYLHHCKPNPIIHCDLKPKNIFLAYGGQVRVAGFGIVQLTHISPKKAKLTYSKSQIDSSSLYMAPEIYRDEIFDTSVDIFSFGLILYEMIEGSPAFHPKSPEEASRMLCLEGLRPPLRNKSKSYFLEIKHLIEECWDPRPEVRPTFAEIIVRLDKIAVNYAKQAGWKGTFKLPWKI